MRKLRLGRVYPISTSANVHNLSHVELAHRFLEAGIRFFQVREKTLSDSLFYQQLLEVRRLCENFGAQFVVNDRADLALAVHASGVHLGQTDLPFEAARRLLGSDAVIGLSTHNRQQFAAAQSQDLDYVAIGPIFPTSTKETQDPPLGVETVQQCSRTSRFPVVAIGGISLETAPEVWRAGAASVAVISDVVNSPDPGERLRRYVALAEEMEK